MRRVSRGGRISLYYRTGSRPSDTAIEPTMSTLEANHGNNDRALDSHDLYSIGPPHLGETPLQEEELLRRNSPNLRFNSSDAIETILGSSEGKLAATSHGSKHSEMASHYPDHHERRRSG